MRERRVALLAIALVACALAGCSRTASLVSDPSASTIVISHDEILTADIQCTSLTIEPGTTLTTDGHNIYCSGTVDNEGTIDTGRTPFASFPLSYGGSGSGSTAAGKAPDPAGGYGTLAAGGLSCATKGCTGGNGASPTLPAVTASLLRTWQAAGVTLFLAGAGGAPLGSTTGGSGAYGLFIAGSRVVGGTIVASGGDGRSAPGGGYSGSGGGGTIVIDYGSGGYRGGRYLVGAGSARDGRTRYLGVGGNGHVAVVRLLPALPAKVVVDASTPIILATSGGGESATVTAEFTAADGTPVADIPVNWYTTSGRLSQAIGTTDASGRATVTLSQPVSSTASSTRDPDAVAAVVAEDAGDPDVEGYAYVTILSDVVSLLPVAGAGGSWEWTADCPVNPSPCRPADGNPDAGWLQLNGLLWNIGKGAGADGQVEMTLGPAGDLQSDAYFASAPAGAVDTWVRGYPGASYGVVLGYPSASPPESPSLRLPEKLGGIPPDLIATERYDVLPAAGTAFAFGYDLWLEPSRALTSITDGTLGIMVSTDDSGASSVPGALSATVTMPYEVDGVVESGYDAWDVYVDNVGAQGQTGSSGGTIFFVLDEPVEGGKVSIDMSDLFTDTSQLLQSRYQWPNVLDSYWLDTIQLGTEFGPAGKAAGGGAAQLSDTISDYCFGLHMQLPSTGC